ncbi:glycosyltransferase family 2 protein [Roseimaritima ulvae]|uniref:4,4'-diaponeurosporenoate glycosyltransferase n=1 Tax=Roseimaritima ulvae TaxID=980254 RepID=A0A5B9QQC2_9BACT|nr:glycosyltransferase family A protein [Roseimaritima ulvae]QEG40112.1 4,4'-diaponeurosporenoate glycosyltransferase [Roseimaritima ulvae]
MLVLAVGTLLLAGLPLLLYLLNLPLFCIAWQRWAKADLSDPQVSVLIPARDEEEGIGQCLQTVLASRGVELEVIVLDDQSHDATADVVRVCAAKDQRVQLIAGVELPQGWNGKQHACWRLADRARHRWLVFLDADVRLAPDAIRCLLAYADRRQVGLLSAFPHQETGTLLEKMLIPMMHIVLLGYLPLLRMRACTKPAYAAGCGQLFVTRQDLYQQMGTHAAIRDSRHDGIKLPRAYRTTGLSTDVVDGSTLARCRMYRSGAEVVRGLLKNADEGIANAALIVPFSLLLLGSTVAPLTLLAVWPWLSGGGSGGDAAWWIAAAAAIAGWTPRVVNAWRFKQSAVGAILHPLAVLVFVVLQWVALAMQHSGRRVRWRGRD